jgi:stringent starvation protein B
MHQWISDSDLTPHIVVAADTPGVDVPRSHVRDGKIVLNVAYAATNHLEIGNEWIEFDARFGGTSRRVRVPLAAVLGVYARETGEGIVFTEADLQGLTPAAADAAPADATATGAEDGGPRPPTGGGSPAGGRARLRVVK